MAHSSRRLRNASGMHRSRRISKAEPKPCYSTEFTSGEKEEEDDIYTIGGDSDPRSFQEKKQALSSNVTITHSPETIPPPDLRCSTRKDEVQLGTKIINLELNS